VPHVSRALYEIAGGRLEILDVEDLRWHYPPTLTHWVRRLEAAREAALAAAGAERYRIWRLYMAAMAHAFDRGWVLALKPLPGAPRRAPGRSNTNMPRKPVPLSRTMDRGEL
jgi:cyclopropane-fatty-acyl-phospholipid synthase